MSDSDGEDEDSEEEEEEEEEEEQSELEDDGLLMAQKRRKSRGSISKKSSKRLKTNSGKQLRFQDRSDSERMEDQEDKRKRRAEGRRMIPSNEAFVYRALRPLPNQVEHEEDEETGVSARGIVEPPSVSGFFDMPCGHCPSFDFCSSKGKAWQFKGSTTLGSSVNSTNLDNGPASFHRKLPKIGLAGIGAGFNAVGGLGAAGGVAPVNPADCVYLFVYSSS
jgi:DNA-directed RNA polymerase III subunit RPC6